MAKNVNVKVPPVTAEEDVFEPQEGTETEAEKEQVEEADGEDSEEAEVDEKEQDDDIPEEISDEEVVKRLGELKKKFKAAHEKFASQDQKSYTLVLEMAGYLTGMKDLIVYGEFEDWLEEEAEELGVVPRTCQRWMEVYRYHLKGDLKGIERLHDAYTRIAKLKERKGGAKVLGRYLSSLRPASDAVDLLRGTYPEDAKVELAKFPRQKRARLRNALQKFLSSNGEKVEQHGAVILIEPAKLATSTTKKKEGAK